MELKVIIDDEIYSLNVPDEIISRGGDFFDRMDRDMDRGWQMDRDWIPAPDTTQRLQIVGNNLLTALETENHDLGRMMAAYILSRAPDIESMVPDTTGEIQNTEVRMKPAVHVQTVPGAGPEPDAGMPDDEARAEAERQVSSVYKVGRHYAFSLLNTDTGD